MPAGAAVHVSGLRELNRAFSRAERDTGKFVRAVLAQIAEPIKLEAQKLAVTEISGLRKQNSQGTGQWAFMRVGVTRTLIYVAPQMRGRKSRRNTNLRRPNMADLLMDKAMQPALDKHKLEVEARVEDALDRIADNFNRGT